MHASTSIVRCETIRCVAACVEYDDRQSYQDEGEEEGDRADDGGGYHFGIASFRSRRDRDIVRR
jgi:hypothetical protein